MILLLGNFTQESHTGLAMCFNYVGTHWRGKKFKEIPSPRKILELILAKAMDYLLLQKSISKLEGGYHPHTAT